MQLCHMMSDNKYRVYFNEKESKNIRLTLGNDISIRNVSLCYYIEKTLPNCFDVECEKVKKIYFTEEASNGVEESPEKFFIELFVLYQVGYFKLNEGKKDIVKQSYHYIDRMFKKINSCERIDSINFIL